MIRAYTIMRQTLPREWVSIIKYVLVGGTTFVLDFGILILFHEAFHVPVLIAASISYWTSIIFNFFMNRAWTFNASASLRRHLIPYCLLLFTNYAITLGMVGGLSHLGLNYALAKVFAVLFSMCWTYVAYKKIIFV